MMEDKGIREWLAEQGATPQQVNSKVVDMIVLGILNGEVGASATVREEVDALTKRVERADAKADGLCRGISRVEERYGKVAKLLEEAEAGVGGMTIADESVKDGVVAFRCVLESVLDVFGYGNMSEAVMCSAIEAASYGMWRAVMGPKDGTPKRRAVL